MKKQLRNLGTLILIGFFMACMGGSDAPKAVAEKFLKASVKMNFDEAKKYATEETGKLLDMMKQMSAMMPDSLKNKETKITMGEEKIDGDNAVVAYKEEGKEMEQKLSLKKSEGKWLVSISKEGMGGANETSPAAETDTASTQPADTSSVEKK